MCFPKSQEKATEKLRKGPVLLCAPGHQAWPVPILPQWVPPSPCSGRPHPPAVGALHSSEVGVPSPRSGCPRSSTQFGVSMSQAVP